MNVYKILFEKDSGSVTPPKKRLEERVMTGPLASLNRSEVPFKSFKVRKRIMFQIKTMEYIRSGNKNFFSYFFPHS